MTVRAGLPCFICTPALCVHKEEPHVAVMKPADELGQVKAELAAEKAAHATTRATLEHLLSDIRRAWGVARGDIAPSQRRQRRAFGQPHPRKPAVSTSGRETP